MTHAALAVQLLLVLSAVEPGEPSLRGRVMSDAWATSSDVATVDYPSGTEIRVAVLGVEGTLNASIAYTLEVDLATETPTLRDAWLRFGEQHTLLVTVGNFKPLFSLEHLSGLPRGTFLEPGLPNAFAINESIGVQLERQQSNWYLGIGAFGESPGVSLAGDEGYGIAARWAVLPLLDERRFIHIGVSGYRKFLADTDDFRIRQRPEARIFSTRLADTGNLAARSTAALALELAAAFGRLSVQAEYIGNRVHLLDGHVAFDGAYVLGSWLLTGEARPYARSDYTIARVKPKREFGRGGTGALELALRFSTLDLDDALVTGGAEHNVTLGVNWYPVQYARLMLNYVRFDIEDSAAVRPLGSPVHRGDALALRAQVDW